MQQSSPNPGDAFDPVEDILIGLDDKQQEVFKAIESLPFIPIPSCHTENHLLLDTALSFLKDISSRQTPAKIKNISSQILFSTKLKLALKEKLFSN